MANEKYNLYVVDVEFYCSEMNEQFEELMNVKRLLQEDKDRDVRDLMNWATREDCVENVSIGADDTFELTDPVEADPAVELYNVSTDPDVIAILRIDPEPEDVANHADNEVNAIDINCKNLTTVTSNENLM